MCNDADLLACAIDEIRESLVIDQDPHHHGIGLGFYSGEEPLFRKSPSAPKDHTSYPDLVEGIKSNALLVHVRHATVGAWKDSNTHPFRFRRWLFAHVGHLPELEPQREALIAKLPPFLARNIKGETDSELAFHLFLKILFDENVLDEPNLEVEKLAGYLHRNATWLDDLHSGTGQTPTYAMVVTDGLVMGSVGRGVPMHYSHREGIRQCSLHTNQQDEKPKHASFRGVMLGVQMSEPGHQWREIADGSLITISRELELRVQHT
jgi:glutamine amidotransferase